MAKKKATKKTVAPQTKKKVIEDLKSKGLKMPHGYVLEVRKRK